MDGFWTFGKMRQSFDETFFAGLLLKPLGWLRSHGVISRGVRESLPMYARTKHVPAETNRVPAEKTPRNKDFRNWLAGAV